MKKLSFFQIILLSSFAAIAVAGVIVFAVVTNSGGQSGLGPVVIWGTFDGTTFTNLLHTVADKEQKYSSITYIEKDVPTYESDITKALSEGQGPDLLLLRQDYAYEDAAKVVTIPYGSISKKQFQDTFAEAANAYLIKDGILALPILIDPLILYWNRDTLSTYGYAVPPTQWAQFYSMAAKMTKKTDSGTIQKSAVALGEFENVDHAKDILATIILQAKGEITSYDSEGVLDSAVEVHDGALHPTEDALRFYTEFSNPSKDHYSWNRSLPNSRDAFSAGDLALYIGYASEAPLIARANPNLNFGKAPLPQVNGADHFVSTAHVYALAIPRTSKNQAGAFTAATALASNAYAQLIANAYGLPAARRDILSKPAQDDIALYNSQALIAHSWVDPNPDATENMFRAMIENTTSGAQLVPDAVGHADQEMRHILSL